MRWRPYVFQQPNKALKATPLKHKKSRSSDSLKPRASPLKSTLCSWNQPAKNSSPCKKPWITVRARRMWGIAVGDDSVRFQYMILLGIDAKQKFGTTKVGLPFEQTYLLEAEIMATKKAQSNSKSLMVTSRRNTLWCQSNPLRYLFWHQLNLVKSLTRLWQDSNSSCIRFAHSNRSPIHANDQ